MWRKLPYRSAIRESGAIGRALSAGAQQGSLRSLRSLHQLRQLAILVLPVAVAVASVVILPACGGGEVRAPNPTRAVDEGRAIEVIRRAVAQEGVRPGPGREVELVGGARLRIDVGVQEHQYGIVYVTDDDAQALGVAIPQPNRQDEKLRIVRGGRDGAIRIVLLYQGNYVYDDLVGESHERTTITAERQLTRDVQDFLTYARTQKFQ